MRFRTLFSKNFGIISAFTLHLHCLRRAAGYVPARVRSSAFREYSRGLLRALVGVLSIRFLNGHGSVG